jgi:hypothetical protein
VADGLAVVVALTALSGLLLGFAFMALFNGLFQWGQGGLANQLLDCCQAVSRLLFLLLQLLLNDEPEPN